MTPLPVGEARLPRTRVLHVLDKFSVDGSKIHGPARQVSYRVPCYDPHRYEVLVCNMRNEDLASAELRMRGLTVVSLGRSKFDPRALTDLCRLIRQWKPSVSKRRTS